MGTGRRVDRHTVERAERQGGELTSGRGSHPGRRVSRHGVGQVDGQTGGHDDDNLVLPGYGALDSEGWTPRTPEPPNEPNDLATMEGTPNVLRAFVRFFKWQFRRRGAHVDHAQDPTNDAPLS